MADGVGFEPTIPDHRIHTFQACAFDRSATHPLEPDYVATGPQRANPRPPRRRRHPLQAPAGRRP